MDIIFDRYEVIKEIGRGSFSEVYLVRDVHLNRLMALKKMKASYEKNVELETLKALSNEALPVVYDYRQDDEHDYLFMEYIEGMTLREYIKKNGRIEIKAALDITKNIASILRYLHRQKPPVIYRDLKPENIMIKADGSVKLIDFGGVLRRSRSLDEDKGNYGTKGYGAPEIFRSKKPEASADIYSLGAVLHEMISGVDPNKPPYLRRPLKEIDKAIPEGVDLIVNKCLESDERKRYQTMDDLIKDMDNYKRLRSKDKLFVIKKLTVSALYACALLSALAPLIRGVDQNDIPFPYLTEPLSFLVIAVLTHILFFKKIALTSGIRCIQKDIFLTEKGYMGLMGVTFFALGCMSMLILHPVSQGTVYAMEQGDEMWVNICNDKERNVLFKNDEEMIVGDKLRLEIPKDDVPENALSIQVVATSKTGKRYVSRVFKVRK